MTALRVAWSRLWAIFAGGRRRYDLDEEMELHLDLLTAEHMHAGLPPAAARVAARRSFGNIAQVKEAYEDQQRWQFIESVIQDVRFAFRMLANDRRLVLGAVVALGLGIGVTNMVFTFVNAVIFRELPLDHPEQLVALSTRPARGRPVGLSFPDFKDLIESSQSFQAIDASAGRDMNVSDEDHAPDRYRGAYVSPGIFEMYGIKPVIGRVLKPSDDNPNAPAVVVVSSTVWTTRYGADAAIIGRTVRVNGVPSTVVGVVPANAKSPLMTSHVWQPLHWVPTLDPLQRNERLFAVVARLKEHVTLTAARAELDGLSARFSRDYPATNGQVKLAIDPLALVYKGGMTIRRVLAMLMAMVVVVLLIACANVANLLLARSAARSREMAIRASIGASRRRLVRQLLIESVVLGVLGGALGLLCSTYLVRLFSTAFAGKEIGGTDAFMPFWLDLSMDWRVFAFVAALCALTAIAFGLVPALHLSKTDPQEAMRDGGRGISLGPRSRRWSGALVVIQLALATVLLTGAGLMTRSMIAAYRVTQAFDTQGLWTMRFTLPARTYATGEARKGLLSRFAERLAANPAIDSATLVSNIPFIPGGTRRGVSLDGQFPAPSEEIPTVAYLYVDSKYFWTLGVPLLQGREFTNVDGAGGERTVIVNQQFVARFLHNTAPIGHRVWLRNNASAAVSLMPATIIGIAPTIPQFTIPDSPDAPASGRGRPPEPVVYGPLLGESSPAPTTSVIVRGRTNRPPIDHVREDLRALDPDVPLYFVRSMPEAAAESEFQVRWFVQLFGLLAAIAIVLAIVGLAAVTSHGVTQRTAEIGVRKALGASASNIVWLMMRRSSVQIAVGLAIGIAGAMALGRVIESLLIETSGRDPITLAVVVVLVASVAAFAALLPARRAARLNPAITLKYE